MILAVLLLFAGVVLGFFGLGSLTNATLGVGLIGVSAGLCILARIAQADYHHKQLIKK